MDDGAPRRSLLLERTTDIVSAYAGHNRLANAELPDLIASVFKTVSNLGTPRTEPAQKPAIPIYKSVTKSAIVCLECGKAQKIIKRHLATSHGLTPDAYRAKWGLPQSYPMVAADYAELRKKIAEDIGLGRKSSKRGGPFKRAR